VVLAVRIPQADDAVEVGGGQRLAIGRRRQHTNAAVVSRYVPALLSVGDVPELQDAILAGGGERPGIAGKGRPGDDAFMGSQRGLRLQLQGSGGISYISPRWARRNTYPVPSGLAVAR